MISYYGTTISPNQLETGEGFLICRNVPIARTGTYEYLGREIGLETDEVVEVSRPELTDTPKLTYCSTLDEGLIFFVEDDMLFLEAIAFFAILVLLLFLAIWLLLFIFVGSRFTIS